MNDINLEKFFLGARGSDSKRRKALAIGQNADFSYIDFISDTSLFSCPSMADTLTINLEVTKEISIESIENQAVTSAVSPIIPRVVPQTETSVVSSVDVPVLSSGVSSGVNSIDTRRCCICNSFLPVGVSRFGPFEEKLQIVKDNKCNEGNETYKLKVFFVVDQVKCDPQSFGIGTDSRILDKERSDLLDKMIGAMKLEKNDYLIGSLLRCIVDTREIEQTDRGFDASSIISKMRENCYKKLIEDISMLRPKVVVSIGPISSKFMTNSEEKLSAMHGKIFHRKIDIKKDVTTESFEFNVVPIFGLDLLLINQSMKKTTWNDLQGVIRFLSN